MTDRFPPLNRRSAPSSAPESIVFIGDSITLGWRDEGLGGWPARLAGALRDEGHAVTVYNLGVRGDTSSDIAGRWLDEIERRTRRSASAAIVFAFGVNDAKLWPDGSWVAPLAECRRNTASLLARATQHYRVLFVGPGPIDETTIQESLNPTREAPLPTNKAIREVSDAIADEAERHRVPFLDVMSALSRDDLWFSALRRTDGLHPPAAGHDRLSALIAAWRPWRNLLGGLS